MRNGDAEVLWVARYDYQSGWVLKEHNHNYYQMICILSGRGTFHLEDCSHSITGGTLFVIRPGAKHGLIAQGNETLKTLDIKFYIRNEEWEKALASEGQIISPCPSEIKNLLERIREEGLKKQFLYQEFSLVYLEEILLHIMRVQRKNDIGDIGEDGDLLGTSQDPVCQRVLEYYRSHYNRELTLKGMAQDLGYHQSYICHSFKKHFNCTPIQYLYRYRIGKARELIVYSDFSLKQIADMTGFKSIHHFTRVFGELEGMTPGQFRDQEKEGIRKDIYLNDSFKNRNYTENPSG